MSRFADPMHRRQAASGHKTDLPHRGKMQGQAAYVTPDHALSNPSAEQIANPAATRSGQKSETPAPPGTGYATLGRPSNRRLSDLTPAASAVLARATRHKMAH